MLVETSKYMQIKEKYDSTNLMMLYAQCAVTDGFLNVKHRTQQIVGGTSLVPHSTVWYANALISVININIFPHTFLNIESCPTNAFRNHANTDHRPVCLCKCSVSQARLFGQYPTMHYFGNL